MFSVFLDVVKFICFFEKFSLFLIILPVLIFCTVFLGISESNVIFKSGKVFSYSEISNQSLTTFISVLIFSIISSSLKLLIAYLSKKFSFSLTYKVSKKTAANIIFSSIKDQLQAEKLLRKII